MQDALVGVLEETRRERALEACGEKGAVNWHSTKLIHERVDGEAGLFLVGVFDVVDEAIESVFAFSVIAGVPGAAVVLGDETVDRFDCSLQQEVGETSLNSSRYGAEKKGRWIIVFSDIYSGRVLREH